MGGALGLAVLVAVSSWRTTSLAAAGIDQVAALNEGFQLAFGIGAAFALVAAVVGCALLRPQPVGGHSPEGEPGPAAEAGGEPALEPATC